MLLIHLPLDSPANELSSGTNAKYGLHVLYFLSQSWVSTNTGSRRNASVHLQQADAAVQQAAGRIMQAKQLAPDIPQIDLAIVRSLQSGIYLDILSGVLSE